MDLADFDREAVLASFLAESEEGLDLMERVLVQMESSPSDPELVHNIFAWHTASRERDFVGAQRTGWICSRGRGSVGCFS